LQVIDLIWYTLAAILVLFLPGGALLAWLRAARAPTETATDPPSTIDGGAAFLADSAALSIAISSIAAMALFYARVDLPPLAVAGLYALCLLALAGGLILRSPGSWSRSRILRAAGQILLAGVLLAGLSAWRLYQARTVALPPWVDSVHHTLAVRVIIERGGLPVDFMPYLPAPFFTHYGFHLSAALFAGWADVPADRAVLWFGQILNALVGFSVFRLCTALRRQDGLPFIPSPLIAGLLATFAFQMPGYYLTWGRYTLATGLILLGPALAAALDMRRDPRRTAPRVTLALLLAGMALTHLFVLLIAGLFLALLWVVAIFDSTVSSGALRSGALRSGALRSGAWDRSSRVFAVSLAAAGLLGLLIAAPWVARVWQYNQHIASLRVIEPVAQEDSARQSALNYLRYLTFLIGPRRSHILYAFSGVGLLFALLHPRRRFLAIWGLMLALLALPWGLRMDPFRPDYFAIVLFFPAALLLAFLLADGAAALARVLRPLWGAAILALAVGGLLFWGARETRRVINPVTVIATADDVRALDWINQNVPPGARFYTNTARWQGQAYRGVDGGYWLMPYTGRAGLIPPIFYGWASKEYQGQVTRQSEQAARIDGCSPEFWNLVQEAGLTHIYLREGRGALQPAALEGCERIHRIYHAGGVDLYEIQP
jgi:hypothetical protein